MDKTVHAKTALSPARLLSARRIVLAEPGMTKTDLIARLLQTICRDVPALDYKDAVSQMLKREQGVSTTLDTGLSIPHIRLEEADSFYAALAVAPHAVKDPQSRLPIKAMFLFLSPAKPEFFQAHLQLLAGLAHAFTAEFINELTALPTAQAVFERLSR